MNVEGTTELRSIRQMAERFAGKELEPRFQDHENYPCTPLNEAALRTAGDLGIFTLTLPEAQGGSGQGIQALCEVLEPLARADAGFAAIVLVNSLAQSALLNWAGPERLAGWNPSALTAFPVYDLPSDPGSEVTAERHEAGYVLRGTADYLALAPLASLLVVPATVNGSGRVAFFMLKPETPGVKVGAPLLSLGLRTCPVADVDLDAVRVPAEALLCDDAAAAYPQLASRFRPAAAAMALGTLRASYRAAKQYAQERYQGGRMIIEYDQVRLMLTNLAVVAETTAALVECMAVAADQGRPGVLSDSGLILVTEQVSRAASDGVQVLGGYGYMQDYGQEKRMRDAKQIEAIFGAAPAKRLELADLLLSN